MKIIFLDYDGVVNTPTKNGDINYPEQGYVNNIEAVRLVSEFCIKYNYSIVVTSTWNIYDGYIDCIRRSGLAQNIVVLGKTEHQFSDRSEAITCYLKKHPEIEKYLVFDDIADMGVHSKFHVHCDYEEGFNEKCYKEAVRIHQSYNEESSMNVLKSTLDIIEAGSYQYKNETVHLKLPKDKYEDAECFLPEAVYEFFDSYEKYQKNNSNCSIHVENMDCLDAAKKMYDNDKDSRIGVLNFSNPASPGGGVRRGALCQEESICLRTTLLPSLESKQAESYYEYYRRNKTFAASDAIIISRCVEVFKDSSYEVLNDSYVISVLSSSAPQVSPFSHCLEDWTMAEMETLLYRRIAGIMMGFIVNGYRRVVLGAYGCGVFYNDAMVVAKVFKKVFEDIQVHNYFTEICFAILDRTDSYNFNCFESHFKNAGGNIENETLC